MRHRDKHHQEKIKRDIQLRVGALIRVGSLIRLWRNYVTVRQAHSGRWAFAYLRLFSCSGLGGETPRLEKSWRLLCLASPEPAGGIYSTLRYGSDALIRS